MSLSSFNCLIFLGSHILTIFGHIPLFYTLYSFVGGLLILLGIPFYFLYSIITRKHLANLKQRLGLLGHLKFTRQHSTRIWLHAASVGEVQAAKAIISELNKTDLQADFIITTVTEQGQVVAKQQLGLHATCLYAPIDLPWIINRFFRTLRPTLYICLETELWPNMLRIAKAQGATPILLNGRMSDQSCRHYHYMGAFMAQVLGSLTAAGTISMSDKKKYAALGLAPGKITVCGNAKYDLGISTTNNSHTHNAPHDFIISTGPRGAPILVAGSTHNGEEEALIVAHKALLNELPELITIIAPRHLNRLPAIEILCKEQKINYQLLSELSDKPRSATVILVDYMGILTYLYSIADYAFCGGSLVDRGGHNIMEPAICGIPPFYGPYMKDFADAADIFKKQKAGFQIKSIQDLIAKIIYFSTHQDKYKLSGMAAKDLAESQQGATKRQVKIILQTLGENRSLSKKTLRKYK